MEEEKRIRSVFGPHPELRERRRLYYVRRSRFVPELQREVVMERVAV